MDSNLTRAMTYLEKMPSAIAGSGGDKATRRAGMVCRRFGLTTSETWAAMSWYNDNRCDPKWSEKDLRHKLEGLGDVAVTRPLGQGQGQSVRHGRGMAKFVPPAAIEKPADDRPIWQRSEQEEELWWAQRAHELGQSLQEFDAACGADSE